MNTFHKWNPNPVNARVEDCAQRAIAAALDVDWDTASDLIYEMAKAMGTTTHDDAAWGAVLRRAGFMRAAIPNRCPDCYTVGDFCREHPRGVYCAENIRARRDGDRRSGMGHMGQHGRDSKLLLV